MAKAKKIDFENEFARLMDSFSREAEKNAINAFNEGYLLGLRYAETVFKDQADNVLGGDNENKS